MFHVSNYCAICIFIAVKATREKIFTELITGFPHILCIGNVSLELIKVFLIYDNKMHPKE
jgi:hypothetical protein